MGMATRFGLEHLPREAFDEPAVDGIVLEALRGRDLEVGGNVLLLVARAMGQQQPLLGSDEANGQPEHERADVGLVAESSRGVLQADHLGAQLAVPVTFELSQLVGPRRLGAGAGELLLALLEGLAALGRLSLGALSALALLLRLLVRLLGLPLRLLELGAGGLELAAVPGRGAPRLAARERPARQPGEAGEQPEEQPRPRRVTVGAHDDSGLDRLAEHRAAERVDQQVAQRADEHQRRDRQDRVRSPSPGSALPHAGPPLTRRTR